MTLRQRLLLHENWQLVIHDEAGKHLGIAETSIPAHVPGCVHTDLLAAALIQDPLVGQNELQAQWIGDLNWTYRLSFEAAPPADGERVDLVFDGLDTLATVTLNGQVLGQTRNQHRRYRIDIGTQLVDGPNQLDIRFDSPVAYALAQRALLGDLPNPYGTPYNFIRKMASNFGWDWGPTLTTAGIWRPVALERWHASRLSTLLVQAVVPSASPSPAETGVVEVVAESEHALLSNGGSSGSGTSSSGSSGSGTSSSTETLRIRVEDPAGQLVAAASVELDEGKANASIDVPEIERWWPVGRGLPSRYSVLIELCVDGTVVDHAERMVGFRHVELDTQSDDDGKGSAFSFEVNGERTWIRGFNWITDDCFPSRVNPAHVRNAIDEATAMNANLLRVWGGGIYEDAAFYDHCDATGVMVWQDFLFACAAYPEEALAAEVEAEAADNVERLMHHPSLIAWNANNENLWGYQDWDWQRVIGDRSWGLGFYHGVLPQVVGRLDPRRVYIDGSPTSLDSGAHPNDPNHGAMHLWDVWNDVDYPHYRHHQPRFAAEFGFQAPATWATMAEGTGEMSLPVDDPALIHRQRAFEGVDKLDRWLTASFGAIEDYDDWLYLTQVNQARAIEVGIGHLRSLHQRCSGVIWWQLNDCWPAISWSVLDSAGRRKPSWYAARNALEPRAIVITPDNDTARVVLINDTAEPWTERVEVACLRPDGSAETMTVDVSVEADSAQTVQLDSGVGQANLIVATANARRAVLEHNPGPVAFPQASIGLWKTHDGVAVEITAVGLVRELCLFADRIDPGARCADQRLTLLDGESFVIHVATDVVDVERWRKEIGELGTSVALRALGDRRRLP